MANLYEGRQAKLIQRRMIVDACRRLTPMMDPSDYQYVGFGGLEFNDFVDMHNALGITRMTSIENDTMIADRVEFNKPYASVKVHIGEAADMLPLVDWSVPSIAWLDYTSALDQSVLNDLDYIVRASCPGSVVLVTVNAGAGPMLGRRDALLQQLGNSMPSGIENEDLSGWGVANVQRRTLQARASTVAREAHHGRFEQLFNFQYQDNSKMLTWGGIIVSPTTELAITTCHFEKLHYIRNGDESLEVRLPTFTERERRHFERELSDKRGRPQLKGISSDDVKAFERIYRWRAS